MRYIRCYCPTLALGPVSPDLAESHHLIHVLRLKPGTEVEVFDGRGRTGPAVVTEIRKKTVILDVKEIQTYPSLKPTLILAMSLAKGGRFEVAVEKCTELGADCLCAVQFDRTVKLGKQDSLHRYERITVAAAKQSGRNWLPRLLGPAPLDQTITTLESLYPNALRVYGGFGPNAISWNKIAASFVKERDLICMIGPEGGFTDREIDLFAAKNFREISINPNILRTETAAVAFASLLGTLKL